MSTLTTLVNHQVRLAQRPVGTPGRECWSFTTEPVAEPAEGGVLVKTLALSLDPAMRGWMNEGKSYIPPVGIGEVMRAGGVGTVVASKNPKFAVGDTVSAGLGVQEYCLVRRRPDPAQRHVQDRPARGQHDAVAQRAGHARHDGLLWPDGRRQPKPGETVVVSGAAGAVGQTVGQLARIKGCRVVGIAGGRAKCDWVVNELGFDACIDYKAGNVKAGAQGTLPQGRGRVL
jgi:NADPH-dependent curcumin reductase CurA